MGRFDDDVFGTDSSASFGPFCSTGPAIRRLKCSLYPILEICIEAYYLSISETFPGELAFRQHADAVEHFLYAGADADAKDDATGGSCLHFAAGSGALDICEVLLEGGARPSVRDRRLQTPLWWAMAGGYVDICQMLLSCDDSVATLRSVERLTPLHEAASLGAASIIRILIPFYRRLGLDVRGPHWRTPLHLAAREGHFEVCQALVTGSADPQVACSHGKTAVHYAALCGTRALEICDLFSATRPLSCTLRDASGRTPCELAEDSGLATPELRMVLHRRRYSARPASRSTSSRTLRRHVHCRPVC